MPAALMAFELAADSIREMAGADHTANMQWQTVAEAKIKDAEERRQCALRRAVR